MKDRLLAMIGVVLVIVIGVMMFITAIPLCLFLAILEKGGEK